MLSAREQHQEIRAVQEHIAADHNEVDAILTRQSEEGNLIKHMDSAAQQQAHLRTQVGHQTEFALLSPRAKG